MVQLYLTLSTSRRDCVNVEDLESYARIQVGVLHEGDAAHPVFVSHDLNEIFTTSSASTSFLSVNWDDHPVVWCPHALTAGNHVSLSEEAIPPLIRLATDLAAKETATPAQYLTILSVVSVVHEHLRVVDRHGLRTLLDALTMVAGKAGMFPECIRDCDRLLSIQPTALAYFRKARALMGLDRRCEAAPCFHHAIAMKTLTERQHALATRLLTACQAAGEIASSVAVSAVVSERYPSTPHLPFSPQVNEDDITIDASQSTVFVGTPIVITEKLDGGNCCIVDGKVFARTHSHEATHPSFGPIKTLCEELKYLDDGQVPPGTRLFGENMFGVHSIEYDNLTSFFYLFAVQWADGTFASWVEVESMARVVGVPTVPVVFQGTVASLDDVQKIMTTAAIKPSGVAVHTTPEGFVVRIQQRFPSELFERSMAKFVRRGHIQTDDSWTRTWKKAVLRKHESSLSK